jgi:hypothetical protein
LDRAGFGQEARRHPDLGWHGPLSAVACLFEFGPAGEAFTHLICAQQLLRRRQCAIELKRDLGQIA